MKYKLINSVSKKETICDKVIVDGWDYYVSDKCNDLGGWHIDIEFSILSNPSRFNVVESMREIIATNNPSIDIPKVVDDEDIKEIHALSVLKKQDWDTSTNLPFNHGFIKGYNKSQETHPFSEEDVIEFAEWKDFNFYQHIQDNLYKTMQARPMYKVLENKSYTLKELFQIWQEQQPVKIYYVD